MLILDRPASSSSAMNINTSYSLLALLDDCIYLSIDDKIEILGVSFLQGCNLKWINET